MPPHAATDSGSLTEYSDLLDDGTTVKLTKDAQFSVADFRPVKPLGNGDMGNVYLVAQRDTGMPYAMKVMKKEVLRVRKNRHRAQNERDILASVDHQFLPVLHSHFETNEHIFLVMSYCHGGDLNVLRQKQPEKTFSESACRFYVAEVLLAIEYLHKRKIVYRDLKPENILIQASGHIMLTDFDLSLDLSERKWTRNASIKTLSTETSRVETHRKDERKPKLRVNHVKAFFACGSPMVLSKKTKKFPNSRVTPEELYNTNRKAASRKSVSKGPANSFVGTEEYVAPEIIWGRGHGLPVDWWTLGILLYELYYGKTPFKGANRKDTFYNILCKPVEFRGLRFALTDLIMKLLEKEPEKRLGSVGGAEEIKKHPFFDGLNWQELQYVSRTPVVPDPFSWEEIEKERLAKAKDPGKPIEFKWSFTRPSPPCQNSITVTKSPSESLPLDPGDSRQIAQADSMAEDLIRAAPSYHGSRGNDESTNDCTDMERQSDICMELTTPKEEVRLADVELDVFGDVF